MMLPDLQQCLELSTKLTHIRTLSVYHAYCYTSWRTGREVHLMNYSWKIGEITLWDSTWTNEGHVATLRERKYHFANWADSSRLHNRASSCILQLKLWQCSTHRIDWTTSASFTPWARKEACENSLSVHGVHLIRQRFSKKTPPCI